MFHVHSDKTRLVLPSFFYLFQYERGSVVPVLNFKRKKTGMFKKLQTFYGGNQLCVMQ